MREPTPLTVIGGFLGAGKTTLLNHVLRHASGVRYAVLVNDFGEIAIDDRLVIAHGGDTVTFANGCVCCSLGDSLLDTVDRLLQAPAPPEQFLVEASGVGDPAAIGDLAELHPDLRRDLAIVLCDAASIRSRAADERLADTVERQVHAADLLVLNHVDRCSAHEREATLAWLAGHTRRPVVLTDHGRLDLAILDARSSGTQRAAAPPGPDTSSSSPAALAADGAAGLAARSHSHSARPAHPFYTRVVRGLATGEPAAIRAGLAALGPGLVRAKGLLRERGSPGRWWLVQAVGEHVDVRPVDAAAAGAGESALVLLGVEPLPEAESLAARLGLAPPPPADRDGPG